jgi:hypothetical protein
MRTKAGLHPAQRIMHGPHMQLAIDDAQQDRITVGQAESTPNVSRHLQPTSTHQFASLRIHVAHPTIIQIRESYTFFVILPSESMWR